MRHILHIYIPSVLLALLVSGELHAQNKVVEITGKIISADTQRPIPYATVVNIEKNTAALSDSLGFFHITMLEKETLRISAIGYHVLNLSFKDIEANEINVYIIRMQPKIYEMTNINIYEARWKDFEYEFKQIKTEDNPTQRRIQEWFYTLISPEELALITSSTAIGIPIHFKTPQEKQRKKLAELKRKAHKSDVIAKKFNLQIVEDITGLTGDELEDFVSWCNFNTEFLYYANDYDIINAVKKRFVRYKNLKNNY